MTRKDQRRFIRELARNVVKEALADVSRMPPDWDGRELRRLLAARFTAAIMDRPEHRGERRRFNRTCIERNL